MPTANGRAHRGIAQGDTCTDDDCWCNDYLLARKKEAPASNTEVEPLVVRLNLACVAACDCLVKTPVIHYHNPTCKYRVMQEAANALVALDECYDEFMIGAKVRTPSTLLANIQNSFRRSNCLSAIEREFFTKTVKDDDGEDTEECALNWGAEPEKYVEQFRAALASRVADEPRACECGPGECKAPVGRVCLLSGNLVTPEPPNDSQELRDARFAIGALIAAAGGRVVIMPRVLVELDPRAEIVTFDDPVSGARIFTLKAPETKTAPVPHSKSQERRFAAMQADETRAAQVASDLAKAQVPWEGPRPTFDDYEP